MMKLVLTLLVTLLLLPTLAFAKTGDNDHSLGTFGKWKAFASTQKGQEVCYMVLMQHFKGGRNFKRGPAYLMVTERPKEGSTDVVSYNAGYLFKPTSDVRLAVGKGEFSLFTDKDTAWTRDAFTDHALVTNLLTSKTFTVTGIPATKSEKPITDKFAVAGTDAAYQAIQKACGINQPTKAVPQKVKLRKP